MGLGGDGRRSAGDGLARTGIEDERRGMRVREIETAAERAGKFVERTSTQSAEAPIVFDETDDGALVSEIVIDEVRFGVW